MDEEVYDCLMYQIDEAMDAIVSEQGLTWQEKRDKMRAWIERSGSSCWDEFISWQSDQF